MLQLASFEFLSFFPLSSFSFLEITWVEIEIMFTLCFSILIQWIHSNNNTQKQKWVNCNI